ncbi:MAG: TetR family transcriptional regulator [Streptosporangiales bacterium]|nr:TetR family transcriptional regulator [Streptosporangiales bacterium]
MAGRPRVIDDAAILRTAARVIGEVGPSGLTLSAVASEAGVVPGTLVQRFGSKRGLLLALAARSAEEARGLADRVRGGRGSPLRRLRSLIVASMSAMDTPARFANHLAFLCVDLTDPEFHEHALAVHLGERRAFVALLEEAVTAGELRWDTDVAALAVTLQSAIAGTGLTWALDRRGALATRLRRATDAALTPHREDHDERSTSR